MRTRSNTINKEFERLKQINNQALKDRIILQDPFEEFDPPSRQRSKNTALAFDQIQAIEDLDLKPGSRLWHTRHYFLFSFYNAGIRFGDLCKLKGKNIVDGRLKYLMSKTQTNAKPSGKTSSCNLRFSRSLSIMTTRRKGRRSFCFQSWILPRTWRILRSLTGTNRARMRWPTEPSRRFHLTSMPESQLILKFI